MYMCMYACVSVCSMYLYVAMFVCLLLGIHVAAGTPLYQAPEMFARSKEGAVGASTQATDPKLADLYSLGVLLCELFDEDHVVPWYNKSTLGFAKVSCMDAVRSHAPLLSLNRLTKMVTHVVN